MDQKTFRSMKAISGVCKTIVDAAKHLIRAVGGNVEKDIREEAPGAAYIEATANLNRVLALRMEVDKKLSVTKKTTARRQLLHDRKRLDEAVLRYQLAQKEAIEGQGS